VKILIKKEDLLEGLQRVQGIVEKRTTVPMLSNILIETMEKEEAIKLEATDLEIGVRSIYPARINRHGGIAVSGRKILEIVRELPGGDIDLEVQEGHYIVIRAGRGYFKITGVEKEDFPVLPDLDGENPLSVERDVYKDLLKKTFYAVADSEPRHVLNGALLEVRRDDEKVTLTMVGTDGHRLALCERAIGAGNFSLDGISIIIPKKTLSELKKIVDSNERVDTFMGGKQIHFKGENIYLTSRLIEGNFPDYRKVIPSPSENTATFNRGELIEIVKRVSVMSREKTKAIVIDLSPGRAIFSAKDPEIGESREEIDVSYRGEDLTMGLNYKYLLDALQACTGDEIIMEFNGSLKPVILKEIDDPSSLALIMPMRVQDME